MNNGSFYHNDSRFKQSPYFNMEGYTYVDGFGFAPPPPVISEKRLIQSYSNGLGLSTIGFLLLMVVLPTALYRLFSMFIPIIGLYQSFPSVASGMVEMINILASITVYAIPFCLYMIINRIPVRVAFPFHQTRPSLLFPPVLLAMGVSVLGVLSSSLIAVVCQSLFGLQPVGGNISFPQSTMGIILLCFRIAVLAPILEEVIFRGIAMQSLRRFGDSFALLISSVLFALAHQNLVQAPNAFMMGLLMGYFVIRTNSLWVGILIHSVNNALSLLMSFVISVVPVHSQTPVIFSWYALYLFCGILGLLLLVHKYKDMFALRRSSTISGERGKYKAFFSAPGMIVCLIVIGIFFSQNFAG